MNGVNIDNKPVDISLDTQIEDVLVPASLMNLLYQS